MKRLMRKMMISCQVAGELVTKRSFRKLSLRERIMLRLHLKVCGACQAYEKQSILLDKILYSKLNDKKLSDIPYSTNEELKKRIISSL
ncbi:MAG: hypothetical protein HYZ14_08700 [Bacteroidetes bacterium]|nr:hypothetical protein [Bacteroidota bacterium]